jgi:hypothetical protein
MNVLRNSGVAFDADRLFSTGHRSSVSGPVSYLSVDDEGAFIFYRRPPTGEMTMQKMDTLARLRLGCMSFPSAIS